MNERQHLEASNDASELRSRTQQVTSRSLHDSFLDRLLSNLQLGLKNYYISIAIYIIFLFFKEGATSIDVQYLSPTPTHAQTMPTLVHWIEQL